MKFCIFHPDICILLTMQHYCGKEISIDCLETYFDEEQKRTDSNLSVGFLYQLHKNRVKTVHKQKMSEM